MAEDALITALAGLRCRHFKVRDQATRDLICSSDRHRWPCHASRLLAALDAGLGFHEPLNLYRNCDADGDKLCECGHDLDNGCHFEEVMGEILCQCQPEGTVCSRCTDGEGGTLMDWPCDEYKAITRELSGEGGS